MTRFAPRILLGFALGLTLSGAPRAGFAQLGEDLGSLWLSTSTTVVAQYREVRVGEPFIFYVMTEIDFGDPGSNGSDGMLAWEAAVELPPEVSVVSRTFYEDPFGCPDDTCDNELALGYASCQLAENTPKALVRYDVVLTSAPGELEIRLAGVSQSSTGGDPGWLGCVGSPPDLHKFASGWTTPLRLSPQVSANTSSWSSVKAKFR